MTLILALDQSTSASKALLFDSSGNVLDRESLEHRQHYPRPGWVEHDAEEIWQNSLRVLRTVLDRQPGRAAEIAGLSIANQRETVVVFERGSGRPLGPAIVWQCRRGQALCAAQVAAGQDELVRDRTGLRIDPYFSASKLQWLVRERPELRARLEAGEALIGTIEVFLIHRLTRGAVFAGDSTNASRTLLFDIRRLDWDAELCGLWEVPRAALPEVRDSFARFGETTIEGALPRPVPICGVMGDSQAALLAHGCFAPGSAKATFGTGSSILVNTGAELRRSGRGGVTALAWVHQSRPVYALEGLIISAASTLTWLRDQLRILGDLDEVEALAADLPDNGGVYLVPAFSGLGYPHWAPAARAAVVGLSAHSDRRHLVRAALEAIAYQLRDAFEALRGEASVSLDTVQCDGGPTSNRLLMQLAADLTGVELRVPPMPDCSALGASRAGLVGLGLAASPAALPPTRGGVAYRPRMEQNQRDRLIAGWRQALRQVAPTPLDSLP